MGWRKMQMKVQKKNINMPLHTHARTHTHTYCKYNRPLVPKLGEKKPSKTDSRRKISDQGKLIAD